MKKLILPFLVLFSYLATAQSISADKNAVIHSQPRIPTTNDADCSDPLKSIISIQYFDGLGRPLQKVGYQQSPTQKDIVSGAVIYDAFGRVIQTALPSPSGLNMGAFVPNPTATAQNFYNDTAPFSRITAFDNSPLNQLRQSQGAGQDWQNNNKFTQQSIGVSGIDVPLYEVDNANNINLNGTYPPNSLLKKRLIDEQGNTINVYTDKAGLLIQRQVQDGANSFATTYYVYDDFSQLKAVIQPQVYQQNQSIAINSTAFENGVFFYIYDDQNRLIQKKVPNAKWEYLVYDKFDRLVYSQDGQERQFNKWKFFKYDRINRIVLSGEKTDSRSQAQLDAEVNAWSGQMYESPTTSPNLYYSNNAYPSVSENEVYEVNYYDNYTVLNNDLTFSQGFTPQYPNATGLLTGTRRRATLTSNWVVKAVYYDDKGRAIQGQEKFLNSSNITYIGGDMQLDFQGNILKRWQVIKGNNRSDIFTKQEYAYDHANRKTAFNYAIGLDQNTPTFLLATYGYDEIGRLIQKKIRPDKSYQVSNGYDYIFRPPNPSFNTQDLARKAIFLGVGTYIPSGNGNNFYLAQIDKTPLSTTVNGLQTLDYSYNIRGGLRCINCTASNPSVGNNQNDLFSMKLDYQETNRYFDGNIASQAWLSKTQQMNIRSYTYSYDNASRLTNASYAGGALPNENYSLNNISYDKNGNIQSLNRFGMVAPPAPNGGAFGLIDQLSYTYGNDGNRLQNVSDAINGNLDVGDFRDKVSSYDYTYWHDGSLASDANKNISNIYYDTYLKRPSQLYFANGSWQQYSYTGDGTRLSKITSDGHQTFYYGDLILEKNLQTGNLEVYQVTNDEGRSILAPQSGAWGVYLQEYNYLDHLGNLRLSFRDSLTLPINGVYPPPVIISENNQDPYGLLLQGINFQRNTIGVNHFDFTKRERDVTTGYIDLINRQYDYQIGRFTSVDPITQDQENQSPFQYGWNNPVRFSDPNGDFPIILPFIPEIIEGVSIAAQLVAHTAIGVAIGAVVSDGLKKLGTVQLGASQNASIPYSAQLLQKQFQNSMSGGDKQGGKGAEKTKESSRAARREVMRDEKIPTSQQPESQSKNDSGKEYSYKTGKAGGGTQVKSVQQQTMDRSHQGQNHWEAGKVKTDRDGNKRMNDYGRPKLDNDKSKVNY